MAVKAVFAAAAALAVGIALVLPAPHRQIRADEAASSIPILQVGNG